MRFRNVTTGLMLIAFMAAPLPAQFGGPKQSDSPIKVFHGGGIWTIRGDKQLIVLDESDLALRVVAGPVDWEMAASKSDDMLVKSDGEVFPMRLADARRKEIVPYETGFKTGVKIMLGDWRRENSADDDKLLDLTLHLTIALEGKDEDLVFDVAADEGDTVVRRLDWPMALKAEDIDYTVLSNIRGVLLPRNWPKAYHPIRSSNLDGSDPEGDTSEVQSNVIECWSMSWWGFKKGPAAMMVIVETPDDAAYQFSHPAGGPTVIGPRWRGQLGKLSYMRSARICFFPEGDYVDLAKRYRRYALETGLLVSLKEKIARANRRKADRHAAHAGRDSHEYQGG